MTKYGLFDGFQSSASRGWWRCERRLPQHRAVFATARALARWRQGGEGHAAALKDRAALGGIVAQRGQLALGRPARRIVQVKRRPGVVLRVIAQPGTPADRKRSRRR